MEYMSIGKIAKRVLVKFVTLSHYSPIEYTDRGRRKQND